MKVTNVVPVGNKPVYDISVSDAEHYVLKNGVVTHNTGAMYSANTVLMIGRQQEKGVDGDIGGWNFILNIEKSRKVKEKSKIPIRVTYAGGVDKTSGLMDMALEAGFLVKPSNGWYQRVDKTTGEVCEPKVRAKDLTIEFFKPILNDPLFKQTIEHTYKVSHTALLSDEGIDQEIEAIDNV